MTLAAFLHAHLLVRGQLGVVFFHDGEADHVPIIVGAHKLLALLTLARASLLFLHRLLPSMPRLHLPSRPRPHMMLPIRGHRTTSFKQAAVGTLAAECGLGVLLGGGEEE